MRQLPELTISKIAVGPMDNNAYLLRCVRTGEAVLIDAAAEADRLLELIGDNGLADEQLFVEDRLHFSPAGYELLAAKVRPFITK